MENMMIKFQKIYKELKKEKGSFFLFMILKMDEFTNKWSIVVSAPWISVKNQKESFNYIADKITAHFTKEEISTIARLGIFQSNEHLVRLMTESLRVKGGAPIKLENTKVNGFQIHEAYIFESVPPAI